MTTIDPSGLRPIRFIVLGYSTVTNINLQKIKARIEEATGAKVILKRESCCKGGLDKNILTIILRERGKGGYGWFGDVYFGSTDPMEYTSTIYLDTIQDKLNASKSRRAAIEQMMAEGMSRSAAERSTEENFRTNVGLHELGHTLGQNAGHTSSGLMSNPFYDTTDAWTGVGTYDPGWVSPSYFPGSQ